MTKKKKKKHNKIITLAKDKLNMIDTLLSSALNDLKISYEEFPNIMTEKNAYENMKNMSKKNLRQYKNYFEDFINFKDFINF